MLMICRNCKYPVELYQNCTLCGSHRRMEASYATATCPECQNNPSYITQDDSMNACSCRTCGGYEKPKPSEKELAEQQFEIWWKLNMGFLSVEPFHIEEGIARSAWLASRGIK